MKKKILSIILCVILSLMMTACDSSSSKDASSSSVDTASKETQSEEVPKYKEFMIKKDNRIDYQANLECSGYSSAYVIRSLGKEADGLQIYKGINKKNSDGTVNPDALIEYLNNNGYNAEMKKGTFIELKNEISKGVPVIVLVKTAPGINNYHYLPLVGYNEQEYFAADSLKSMKNEDNKYYNRKITNDDFEEMWDTEELGIKHVYITISLK